MAKDASFDIVSEVNTEEVKMRFSKQQKNCPIALTSRILQ